MLYEGILRKQDYRSCKAGYL